MQLCEVLSHPGPKCLPVPILPPSGLCYRRNQYAPYPSPLTLLFWSIYLCVTDSAEFPPFSSAEPWSAARILHSIVGANSHRNGTKRRKHNPFGVELDEVLRHEHCQRTTGNTTAPNYRNGYFQKTRKTQLGEIDIRAPRDHQGNYELKIINFGIQMACLLNSANETGMILPLKCIYDAAIVSHIKQAHRR